MSHRTLPLLYLNLAGEMMYIIDEGFKKNERSFCSKIICLMEPTCRKKNLAINLHIYISFQ